MVLLKTVRTGMQGSGGGFLMRNAGIFGLAVVFALGVVAVIPALVLADEGETVTVTRPGVVFHAAGSNDFRGRGVERSIGAAINAGYTPCRVCFGARSDRWQLPDLSPQVKEPKVLIVLHRDPLRRMPCEHDLSPRIDAVESQPRYERGPHGVTIHCAPLIVLKSNPGALEVQLERP